MFSDWAAKLFDFQRVDGGVVVTIGFQGPGAKYTLDFRFQDVSDDAIKSAAANEILRADAAATKSGQITLTRGQVLDLSAYAPVTPPPPTQADLDRAAYFTAKTKVERIARLLADGSTHVVAKDLSDAQAAWNALTFDPAWET